MDAGDVIPIAAALISVGSVSVAIWATGLSRKALNLATRTQTKAEEKEFAHTKSDLLNQVADTMALLERRKIDLGMQMAAYETQTQPVRKILENDRETCASLLTQTEIALKDLEKGWNLVNSWNQSKPFEDLMSLRSLLYKEIKETEVAQRSTEQVIESFKANLQTVQERLHDAR